MASEEFSIYHYTDVRFFLRDYYKFRKKNSRTFSYRQFANKADVSTGLFQDVIAGRRMLTEAVVPKFATAMKLAKRQQEYFLWMVRFARSKTSEEKNESFNHMCHYRSHARMRFLAEDSFEFYSSWIHGAIRLLASLPDFKEDPEWIVTHLDPTPGIREVKNSLKLLEKLELLTRNKSGTLELGGRLISTDYELDSFVIKRYNREMIELGALALEKLPKEQREVSSLQVSVSKKMYPRFQQRLRIFKEELLAMAIEEKEDPETILQLNLQLFPLLKNMESTE